MLSYPLAGVKVYSKYALASKVPLFQTFVETPVAAYVKAPVLLEPFAMAEPVV